MDRQWRRDVINSAPLEVRDRLKERSCLADLDRQYSLGEICAITRAAPARMLGLTNKGHLGPGADADITIYDPHENQETMFQLPRYVIKAGQTIIDNGELRAAPQGKTLHVAPDYDPGCEADIAAWFERCYTVQFENYPVGDEYVPHPEKIACG
jgi:formylmethanofuran dehydrogenase subunit A